MDRATMRGLKAVKVVIDNPQPATPREALDNQQLQTLVELRLQNAGIATNPDAVEFLGVNATYTRERRGPYAAAFAIGLYQVVMLGRERSIKSVVETWGLQSVQLAQPKQLHQVSRKNLEALVDQFIVAYRSVNPK